MPSRRLTVLWKGETGLSGTVLKRTSSYRRLLLDSNSNQIFIGKMSDQLSHFSLHSELSPLPPADRARQVSEALVDYIAKTSLKAGDRLPAERELMATLAVGRSTIREVMRRFQALGVIETRKGSGNYLLKPISRATIHMPLSMETAGLREGLLQTLQVRRGLECEAAMVAAQLRTEDDLADIQAKLTEMERVHLEKGASGPEDFAFHLAVYDATHNPLFRQLLEQMREAFERFWNHPFERHDFARRSFPFHRTLFEAIVAQDAEAARGETLKILAIVEEDIKEMSR